MSGKRKIIVAAFVLIVAGVFVAVLAGGKWKSPTSREEEYSINTEEYETNGTETGINIDADTVTGIETGQDTETDINADVINPNSVIKAMVYMESSEAGGNGSIYEITEDEVIIVTTYHLLHDSETIGVRFYDNMYAEASVIGVNEKHDVGFVKIPLNEIPGDTVKRIKAIQRNDSMYDSLSQGSPMAYHFLSYDGIFVCQETREGSIGAMNWYVEDFDDELIYNYCKIQPGMSGCAAVAEDGSYIGMVIGGYENESAALSIRVIDKVYQELKEFTKS